ncbi:MAG: tetratricopeptide repeat protein [Spirochaetaceae bacterium]|nr:tetratricopeptide repeat protein [Spirochaetaceae bacterium]
MRRTALVFSVFIAGTLLSCKSAPETVTTEMTGTASVPLFPEETAVSEPPPSGPPPMEEIFTYPEAEMELAEAELPQTPPPETEPLLASPEPSLPIPPQVSPAAEVSQAPPDPRVSGTLSAPEASPDSQTLPDTEPPAENPVPAAPNVALPDAASPHRAAPAITPDPPAFLRPAEQVSSGSGAPPVPSAPSGAAASRGAEISGAARTDARPENTERITETESPAVRREAAGAGEAPAAASRPRDEITRSRTVRAAPGQTVEIPFRGNGWVYHGERNDRPGVSFLARRDDSEGRIFSFRPGEAGEFELTFSRQDFIRDFIQNDEVRLVVENLPTGSGETVTAPRWPPAAGETAAAPTGRDAPAGRDAPPPSNDPGSAAPAPVIDTPPPVTAQPELGSDELLSRAREEVREGRPAEAVALLDRFRERYPLGSDEAWWLYGQALEAPGPGRDMRSALAYYRRLMEEYPQSQRVDAARRRIAYIERFYINIP